MNDTSAPATALHAYRDFCRSDTGREAIAAIDEAVLKDAPEAPRPESALWAHFGSQPVTAEEAEAAKTRFLAANAKRADDDPWKECMPTIAKGLIAATILIGLGIAIGAVIWA